ncbi:MAG TPA: sulfocyanin-like copper-binding protein [Streptosporangiaceae bacterium]|nr:sulfocyanin-like copper-binding protein [Streptosporangiaceae bacterium]
MTRKRISVLAGAAVLAVAGLGTGVALVGCGSPGQPAAATSAAAPAAPASSPSGPDYSWYQSMMGGYYGSGGGMMGGSSYGWMMSQAGYQWMTGGTGAPGWMRGQDLPAFMMGGAAGTDPGTVMGTLFAGAPDPRVSPAEAQRLGSQVPAGASIDRSARTITFTATSVSLVVLASPAMPAESFRIAGMTNPSISVPAGAHVTVELINADEDMAHGLVITSAGAARSWMPMMTAAPAFSGSALWFLGKPTTAGMHTGTLTFTAATPGSYQYLCPVPGHAQKGMAGTFTVR